MTTSRTYRLGVDVGGSFTDLLLLCEDKEEIWLAKVPSTLEDQSVAVINSKDQILKDIPKGADVVLNVNNHGMTIATNPIHEQKGAKVVLVVTEGYRDILQTKKSRSTSGLAGWNSWPKPEPLAPLELTIEAPVGFSVMVKRFERSMKPSLERAPIHRGGRTRCCNHELD